MLPHSNIVIRVHKFNFHRETRAITSLATFYIPLSFVSSLLGMNVVEISSQKTSIWLFFIIAVPLTLISLIALANWETLTAAWEYLFSDNKFKFSRSRRTRW